MNLRVISIFVLAAALLFAGPARRANGQSLADLARQEAARRKTIRDPARVLTNSDLRAVPPSSASGAPGEQASPAPAAAAPGSEGEAAPGEDKPAPAGPARDQAYWSKRMKELQLKLDTDQTLAAALQSRVNALTADFTSHDDPVQRAQIGQDRQKALDEYNRMQKGIEDDKKAIANLQEEARRAGVPPGWLRS